MWKIEKTVKCGKYIYAVVREHPRASRFGYVYLHRIIVENHLNRILAPDEIVHHKDGNRKNNNIKNLEVMKQSEHARKHGAERGEAYCLLKCPECEKKFERPRNRTFLIKPTSLNATFCSPRCRGLFSQKIQANKKSKKMIDAIKKNIVKIYRKFKEVN